MTFMWCARGWCMCGGFSQNHEVLLARIGRGGFFGEINIFEEATATASVYAMDDVQVAVIPNATFPGVYVEPAGDRVQDYGAAAE